MAQEEEFSSEEEEQMGAPLSEGGVEGRRVMPLRHDKGVLSYMGGAIGRYLRDVEDLVRWCGGDEENMLYYVTYYCDDERERQLTNLYNRLSKKSWKAFKREATIQFEGSAAKGRRYTLEMVEELVAKRGAQGFAKRDDVIEYQRDFKAFADELIAKKVTSEGEMSRLFMRGLDEQLRSQVKLRLEIRYPSHQAGTPYTVKQLVDTLLYMSDNGAIAMTATGTATVGKTEGVDVRVFAEAVKGFTAAVERYGSQPANATSAPRSVGRP